MGTAGHPDDPGRQLECASAQYLNEAFTSFGMLSSSAQPTAHAEEVPVYEYGPSRQAEWFAYWDRLNQGLSQRYANLGLSDLLESPAVRRFVAVVFPR